MLWKALENVQIIIYHVYNEYAGRLLSLLSTDK